MSEDWEIDWKIDRWTVEVKRWAQTRCSRPVEVRLVFRPALPDVDLPAIRECSVTHWPRKPVVVPWPWSGTPTDPSEVIATARRLADEYIGGTI